MPAAALFGATPFGLESADYLAWMNFHGGNELLAETFEPHNVHLILCGTVSPEAVGWFRTEVAGPDDLRGLKFRAAGLGGEIMSELGMSVTMLPAGEFYQTVETGVLNATESSLPTVDEQLGFYQVAKHYYLPGWHQPSANLFLYINLDAWRDLDAGAKVMIETACMAGCAYSLARAEALQGEALARFEEMGVAVRTYDDATLNALHETTEKVMERRSAQDSMFTKVYKSMISFQHELTPWKEQSYLPRDWLWRNVYEPG